MSPRELRRSKVLIRPAINADCQAIAELCSAIDELHAQLLPTFFTCTTSNSHAQELRLREANNLSTTALLVAVCKSQVIGLIELSLYDTPQTPGMVQQRRLHVERLVVSTQHRRQGIGRKLLAAATDWAARRQATQIVLTVWEGNRAAERFYRALGYRVISRVLELDLK